MYLAMNVKVKPMFIGNSECENGHNDERQECIEAKYEAIAVVIHSIG